MYCSEISDDRPDRATSVTNSRKSRRRGALRKPGESAIRCTKARFSRSSVMGTGVVVDKRLYR